MDINGIPVEAFFHDEDVESLLQPLLQKLAGLQKEKARRLIVMIAAPPGAGKTTFAGFLEHLAGETLHGVKVQAVGMDGFHQRQEYLTTHTLVVDGEEIPMVQVKGAPETFDLEGLREHIEMASESGTCGWPTYNRHLHNPVEDAITIDGDILLIEGNYLLLEEEGWNELAEFADYTISLRADEKLLRARLIDRKEASGNSREAAIKFVDFSDMRNVRRCLEKSKKADLTLQVREDGHYERIHVQA